MIIFDLDGTLADCSHRQHFVDPIKAGYYETSEVGSGIYAKEPGLNGKRFKSDWRSFHESCSEDTPIMPTLTIFRYLHLMDNEIQIWSGRCESVRAKTEKWLSDHLFDNFEYPVKLKMRPIGDSTPDDVLKMRWLDEAIAEGKTVDYCFDDRPKVVRAWRARGVFVFNCAQHEEEF